MTRQARAATALTLLSAAAPAGAHAAEIKSLTATVIEIILREIGSEFERATGHQVAMTSTSPRTSSAGSTAGSPLTARSSPS
jgi:hypothetical protein